jgi:putative serine protease PepD
MSDTDTHPLPHQPEPPAAGQQRPGPWAPPGTPGTPGWVGAPAPASGAVPGGPQGPGGAPPPARPHDRRPGWPGTLAAAVLAAVLASGATAAAVTALDEDPPAATTSSSATTGDGRAPQVPLTGERVDWHQVASAVSPSVVTIQVRSQTGSGEGTGIVLDDSGHVLTNNHVAAGGGNGAQIRIILSDGRLFEGSILGTDPTTDLAVLQIKDAPSGLTPARFGDSAGVQVGQQVMAVGNPLGLSDTVTTGIVSATDRPVATQNPQPGVSGGQGEAVVTNAIQTDAAINPGNSGGPLVDATGRVIGINSSIASTGGPTGSAQSGNIGLGFAIPGNEAQRIAKELLSDGTADHAWLGVTLRDTTAQADGAQRLAAEVVQVVDGTPAADAGLRQGDAVVAVDGESVTGAESLTAHVRERAPGAKVELTVVRDGAAQKMTVTLGTRPAS